MSSAIATNGYGRRNTSLTIRILGITEVTLCFFLTVIRLLWSRDLIEPREPFFRYWYVRRRLQDMPVRWEVGPARPRFAPTKGRFDAIAKLVRLKAKSKALTAAALVSSRT
jgi:hypothetical protein